MSTLRRLLSWLFAFSCAASLEIAIRGGLHTAYRQYGLMPVRNLIVTVLFTCVAAIFGIAWWATYRGWLSARGWGLAASVIYVALPVWLAIRFSQPLGASSVVLAVGIAGVVAFSSGSGRVNSEEGAKAGRHDLGDGIGNLSEGLAGLLIFVVFAGVFVWWNSQIGTGKAPGNYEEWYRVGMAVLVGLAVATVHELGHTVTGLALGMRLRGFEIGPFQWHVRDGRWRFQFSLEGLLLTGGATVIVPATPDFPRRSYISMVVAGPLLNLATGVLALWVAFPARSGWTGAGAPLALFGAWSLVLCAGNLLPFRVGDTYSDGAALYQSLSNGPWADFHRLFVVSGSTLVTPVRPKDFDIQAIQRTARAIRRGSHGLLLRLWAYTCFLDREELHPAGEALSEAEKICRELPTGIPGELHTSFVFGNAYVRCDAVAAREWWSRVEARKRIRLDADYWLARGALDWVDRNFEEATKALEKASLLAHGLPDAGAYEFERHCCAMLRRALDEAASSSQADQSS